MGRIDHDRFASRILPFNERGLETLCGGAERIMLPVQGYIFT